MPTRRRKLIKIEHIHKTLATRYGIVQDSLVQLYRQTGDISLIPIIRALSVAAEITQAKYPVPIKAMDDNTIAPLQRLVELSAGGPDSDLIELVVEILKQSHRFYDLATSQATIYAEETIVLEHEHIRSKASLKCLRSLMIMRNVSGLPSKAQAFGHLDVCWQSRKDRDQSLPNERLVQKCYQRGQELVDPELAACIAQRKEEIQAARLQQAQFAQAVDQS